MTGGRAAAVVVLVLAVVLTTGWWVRTSFTSPGGGAEVARGTSMPTDQAARTEDPEAPPHRTCAQTPSVCGYPDESNTGVPAGTTLTKVPDERTSGAGWAVHPDGWIEVTQDGAVLEGIETALPVLVTADDVTIRHAVIRASGETAGIGLRHADGTTVTASQIGPPAPDPRLKYGIQDLEGDAVGTVISRTEISRVATGISVPAGVVSDNYLHSFEASGDDHVNGIVSYGSDIPLQIRHNTVLNPLDQTDAVALFQDFGVEANRLIAHNLLAGGSYTLYAGGPPEGGQLSSNIRVVGNRFARTFYSHSGTFGPATSFDREGEGNEWRDNIWDDTGAPVPPP